MYTGILSGESLFCYLKSALLKRFCFPLFIRFFPLFLLSVEQVSSDFKSLGLQPDFWELQNPSAHLLNTKSFLCDSNTQIMGVTQIFLIWLICFLIYFNLKTETIHPIGILELSLLQSQSKSVAKIFENHNTVTFMLVVRNKSVKRKVFCLLLMQAGLLCWEPFGC